MFIEAVLKRHQRQELYLPLAWTPSSLIWEPRPLNLHDVIWKPYLFHRNISLPFKWVVRDMRGSSRDLNDEKAWSTKWTR